VRAAPFGVMYLLVAASAAFAAEPMAPSDIQATFFNGQPFTASTLDGTQFKMTFTSDGKMSREPLAHTGYRNNGTWKLDAKGFCTSWNRAKATCYTIIPSGENKWSVQKEATVVATWTK
jgi:hypothetical protein